MKKIHYFILIIVMIVSTIGSFYALREEIIFLGLLLAILSIGILSLMITNAYSWKKLNSPKRKPFNTSGNGKYSRSENTVPRVIR